MNEATDDEREALETIIAVTWRDMYSTPTDRDFADAILSAGFRRPPQVEPSDALRAVEIGLLTIGREGGDVRVKRGLEAARVALRAAGGVR